MPETVTGSDLRARADGLKTVIEGDSATFSRDALVGIVSDIRQDLANAANMLERHEKDARDREQPQNIGAGSGQPTTRPFAGGTEPALAKAGGQLHPVGTAPSHQPGDDRAPATNTPPQAEAAASRAEADPDRHEKPRAKDKAER